MPSHLHLYQDTLLHMTCGDSTTLVPVDEQNSGTELGMQPGSNKMRVNSGNLGTGPMSPIIALNGPLYISYLQQLGQTQDVFLVFIHRNQQTKFPEFHSYLRLEGKSKIDLKFCAQFGGEKL